MIGNLFACVVSPHGRLVLTLEAIEKQARRRLRLHLPCPIQVRLPGRAISGMDAAARSSRQPRQPALFHPRLGADRGIGAPRRQVLPRSPAPSSGSWRRCSRATRSMPPSSPAASSCRAGATQSWSSSPAASASRPSAACSNICSTAARAGPIIVLYGNETRADIAYAGVLEAARAQARHQDLSCRGTRCRARPISGLHRRDAGARCRAGFSRAHLLHVRAAGDGEDLSRRCCSAWACRARASRSTISPAFPDPPASGDSTRPKRSARARTASPSPAPAHPYSAGSPR